MNEPRLRANHRFLLFLFWFNAYENPLYTLIESIKQTINLTKGPETGIINGDVYNTIDTPRNYLATFYLNLLSLCQQLILKYKFHYYIDLHPTSVYSIPDLSPQNIYFQ